MRCQAAIAGLLIAPSVRAIAQTPPYVDVASIKENKAGRGGYATAPRFDIEAKPDREFKAGEFLPAVRESTRQPLDVLIVDRAERPTEN